MLAATPKRGRRPGFRAVLLALLFVTHFFCAAGAMDTAAAAQTEGASASAAPAAAADAPASDGADKHHLCQADSSADADQRTTAVAAAVLLGLGAGTALPLADRSSAVVWRPPVFVAAPWSGTRLLFSLGVQRV